MSSSLRSSPSSFHGVTDNEDLQKGLLHRDTRPLRHRMADVFTSYSGEAFLILALFIVAPPFFGLVYLSDVAILITPFFYLYVRNKRKHYAFSAPLDEVEASGKPGKGMFFLGNNRIDGSGVYFSKEVVTTHMLVFGSTGSGKTRFLLGLFYQALLVGSGCMYVDGKGDNTVLWLASTLARRVGREDDFLVVNFLTGSSGEKRKPFERISNTMALFSNGDAEQIRSLLVGLMREAGGDGAMWKGRASIMLKGILNALVYLRDEASLNLDITQLQDVMPLDEVVNLSFRRDIPKQATEALKNYLAQIPGYTEEDALKRQIAPKCYEQHGFLIMQLTELMGDLTDAYGHITNAPMGEVDFKDLVFNRRVLFVMLPALQRDPDSLAGLGKIAVAGVRAALGPALGNKAEGSKAEVIDSKPSASSVPFLIILDEYGYYSVPGFAVVAAQARSLGVCVIFAGQDYPSFKKGGDEEAASTVANTNIKICLKLEDPEATFEIIRKRAGTAHWSQLSDFDKDSGSYKDGLRAKIDSKDRINLRDLVSQQPGAGHVIFGDTVARFQSFYADPGQIDENRINKFLMVNRPNKEEMDAIRKSNDKVRNTILGEGDDDFKKLPFDEGLKILFSDISIAQQNNAKGDAASHYALGMQIVREEIKSDEFSRKLSPKEPAAKVEDGTAQLSPAEGHSLPPLPSVAGFSDAPPAPEGRADKGPPPVAIGDLEDVDIPDLPPLPGSEASSGADDQPDDSDDSASEILSAVADAEKPQESVAEGASEVEGSLMSALRAAVAGSIYSDQSRSYSPTEKAGLDIEGQLAKAAQTGGLRPEEVDTSLAASVKVIAERVTYTDQPYPPKHPPEKLDDTVDGLTSLLKRLKDESEAL